MYSGPPLRPHFLSADAHATADRIRLFRNECYADLAKACADTRPQAAALRRISSDAIIAANRFLITSGEPT